MKPRDILLDAFEPVLIPYMEGIGFRFAPSRLKFSRTVEGVKQTVHISLSKWNFKGNCQFWSMWGASSKRYRAWYKEQWGELPDNDALGGCADWNIPGWDRACCEHFNLRGKMCDELEIRCLIENIESVGLPYLDRISSLEGAANELVAGIWMFDKAADFLLMAGNKQRAREALELGIQRFSDEGVVDNFEELPRLKERLIRYFVENGDIPDRG